jgi:hypothetical protein
MRQFADRYRMGRSAWELLAEALGIKSEVNWDAANKRRQMQQYGSMDRRNQQGPMPYFKPQGTQAGQPPQPLGMRSNPNAMAQIPAGSDVPGQQQNPLFAPPPRPKSPLSTSPNSPRAMDGGEDGEEDEGLEY